MASEDPEISLKGIKEVNSKLLAEEDPETALKGIKEANSKLDTEIQNAKEADAQKLTSVVESFHNKIDATPANATQQEILDLSASSLAVEQAFSNIENALQALYTYGEEITITEPLRQDLLGLLTTWKKNKAQYIKLLWQSRDVAGNAAAAAEDFANVFLATYFDTNEDINVEEIKSAIYSSIEKIDKDKLASADLSQAFLNLKGNVNAFQLEWESTVARFKLKYGNEKIKELQSAIDTVEVALTNLKRKIIVLGTAVGILSGAAVGITVYGLLCPIALVGALVTALSALGVGAFLAKSLNEQTVLLRDLSGKKKELSSHQNAQKVMEQLEASLNASQDDFQTICERLGALGSVWGSIRTDLQKIEGKLDMATSSSQAEQRLFKVRMKGAIGLYNTLSDTLDFYQRTVTADKLPPKPLMTMSLHSERKVPSPQDDVWAVARARKHKLTIPRIEYLVKKYSSQ